MNENREGKISPEKKPEIVSQAHKDPYTLNIKIFQNFENFKFYPKITESGAIKKGDHHPINSKNYAADYYQNLKDAPGPLLEKIKKLE